MPKGQPGSGKEKRRGISTGPRKRGYKHHKRDYKIACIDKVEDGQSMSSLGKEEGVAVSQIKYWVDNAEAIRGEGKKDLTFEKGLESLTARKFHKEGWLAITVAMNQAKSIMRKKGATLTEITKFVEVVTEKLARFGKAKNKSEVGKKSSDDQKPKTPMDETLDKIEIIVARFTKTKAKDEARSNVSGDHPEGKPLAPPDGASIETTAEPDEPPTEPSK